MTGVLASLAADAMLDRIKSIRGESFDDHVRGAARDTAADFEGLEPEHIEVVFESDGVQSEVAAFKDGGEPPSMETLTAELARITNLEGEVDFDDVTASFWRHFQRRLSTDEEFWRQLQTEYVQKQFDELSEIQTAIGELRETVAAVAGETGREDRRTGPLVEVSNLEIAPWSLAEMFRGPGETDVGDDLVLSFLGKSADAIGKSTLGSLRLTNHGDGPAVSEGVRLRLSAGEETFEQRFPITRGDGTEAMLPFSGAPALEERVVVGPGDSGHYTVFLAVDVGEFPPAWRDGDDGGAVGKMPPSEALSHLHDAGIERVDVHLAFIYADANDERNAVRIAEATVDLTASTNFAEHVMLPGQLAKFEAFEEALDEYDLLPGSMDGPPWS